MFVIIFDGMIGIPRPLFTGPHLPSYVNVTEDFRTYDTEGYLCIPLLPDALPHQDFFSDEDVPLPKYLSRPDVLTSSWFVFKEGRFYVDAVSRAKGKALRMDRTELAVDTTTRILIPSVAMTASHRDTMLGILKYAKTYEDIAKATVALGIGIISSIAWVHIGALELQTDHQALSPDRFTDQVMQLEEDTPPSSVHTDPPRETVLDWDCLDPASLVDEGGYISAATQAYLNKTNS